MFFAESLWVHDGVWLLGSAIHHVPLVVGDGPPQALDKPYSKGDVASLAEDIDPSWM